MTKIKNNEWISGRLWWLRDRELGIKFPLGHVDRFHKTLYSSTEAVDSWNQGDDIKQTRYGGVFNLEYSPDGSLLVAACEKKSILMFDPLNRRLIHGIDAAHDDCVNCVKFLDQRMFATCSDDKTVALWDARNLKRSIRTLQGHSNWVKNIEYSPSDGLLLTSGFDGTIYTWDINSFTENSFLYNRVFHTNGLMRTRLTPDASKMLMCTTAGYLMVVHNLRLSTLSHDLVEFRPNMYRLMQLSQTTFPSTASFTHLFSHTRKHNRVEFLTDFPVGDDAEVISSLQVHPQGWCALSRNVSGGEKSEWTCVHDIQESNNEIQISDEDYEAASPKQFYQHHEQEHQQPQQQQPLETSRTSGITYSILLDNVTSRMMQPTTTNNPNDARVNERVDQSSRSNNWQEIRRISRLYSHMPNSRDERSNSVNDITSSNIVNNNPQQLNDDPMRGRERNIIEDNSHSTTNVELHVSTSDIWEALVAIREAREATREYVRELYTARSNPRNWLLRRSTRGSNVGGSRSGINNNNDDNSNDDVGDNNGENQNGNSHTVVIVGDRGSAPIQNRSGNKPMYAIPRNHKVHQNISRLTHYIQEPNVGSGYIKELCFSADGRLICSPFGNGIRLLAFSNKCEELSNCVPPPNTSVELHELATKVNHSNIVLSTKFSPRHCLLVSGCLGGKIVWYQPVI